MAYFDLIKSSLSEAARKAFEMLPETYQFQDEAPRKSFDKGAMQTKASSILCVLAPRNVTLSSEQQQHITTCADSAQLDRWLARAAVATSAVDVFGDE